MDKGPAEYLGLNGRLCSSPLSFSCAVLLPHQTLSNLFVASLAVLTFVYLLLGRWDYLLGQGDPEPKLDGLRRFPSMAHLTGAVPRAAKAAECEALAA